MLSSAETILSSRKLVTLHRLCVLLPYGLALLYLQLAVIFRQLVTGGIPACWRLADVVPVSKGLASLDVGDYRLISITLVLSKVFDKIVAVKLSNIWERNCMLPTSQFSYRRGQGTYDALLILSHSLHVALNRGMEGRLVQLSFSPAFDRVSHCGMLYKLRSIGVGGQFLFIVSEFFSASHFCLLLCVCGICCRRACLVVTPWAVFKSSMYLCLLRALLDFFSSFSLFLLF